MSKNSKLQYQNAKLNPQLLWILHCQEHHGIHIFLGLLNATCGHTPPVSCTQEDRTSIK